ncbi:hypothetical protein [Virgibacillus salexigens]|uniref:Uncharacterized protein n=1 Tax=Virgibacillus massiliensis TaxID=1462526 RepID=A0A024QIK4_9BACI|nr:hypothetical protein [Virgibacillus massiliensis]CDQ41791.1 hypothetical protein BN990_04168 [Virgibacillus massiliensis]
MSDKEKQTHAYDEKLEDNTYTMRLGGEVPEGDVNLGYIHTPRLDHNENISIINTSSIPENVIPQEQKVSLAAPDEEGKLVYVSTYTGLDSIQEKPPYDLFPSRDINVTRQFKSNKHSTDEALFYKFEIKYHYDSKQGEPNKVVKYRGDQIKIVDENGNPIDDIKHDIYVMAMEDNPHIHWVKIYLHENTNEIDTFKVRYNHIDKVVPENAVQSSTNELELYSNADNTIEAYGRTKQLIEGGKLRIVNGNSAFQPVERKILDQSDANDEYYYLEEKPANDGYEVFVTQKAEFDPRKKNMFNYKVIARYKDPTGKDQIATVGYINDWVVNPNALLNHEKREYTQEWKQIGMPYGERKLNVKDMIELSQPIGTPSIPQEATYEILDAKGNLMYTTVEAIDNENVETLIQERLNDFAAAKADNVKPDEWTSAKHPNVKLRSLPINHKVSVIAERQKTQWDFEFKVTGSGIIGIPTLYTGNWWVVGDVVIKDESGEQVERVDISTDQHPVTFDSHNQIRIINQRVGSMLEPFIKNYIDKYNNASYEVKSYTAKSDKGDIFLDIDEAGYGYVWGHTTNPKAGGTDIELWETSDNNLDVHGSGHVNYHADGNFTITASPTKLPTEKVPEFVESFAWNMPVITKGENVSVTLDDDGETILVSADKPPIIPLDRSITIEPEPIHKLDGIKKIEELLGEGNIMEQLQLPNDVPIHEVLLRIERGELKGNSMIDQDHRINYRFRQQQDGLIRYPVDQFKDELGVNRLRMSGLYHDYLPVEFKIDYEVAVPVNKKTKMQELFARNAVGAVMIEKTPGIASWKIENGVLKDDENQSAFVGAYNKMHLDVENHVTDFSFKTVGTDDDLVGVLFRVQDEENFYFYAIEGDRNGTAEVSTRIEDVQPASLHEWDIFRRPQASSDQDYLTKRGWRLYHQRVYKVENGKKSVVAEKSTITNQGHIRNWQNNIRVESHGKTTNLYFQTGTIAEEDWKRAYQIETKWNKGAFGVFNYSQNVEFLNIQTSELKTVTGSIPNLNYTGRPRAIMAENTRKFCDQDVKNRIAGSGYNTDSYTPISYVGTVTGNSGEVSVSITGEGPIQVFSFVDETKLAADVDLVAWTHYEDLQASPLFAIKIDDSKKLDIDMPKVEDADLEVENWYLRIKNGRFEKKLQLPYFEPQERTPSIYKTYPVLLNYAPKEPDDIEEVTLQYAVPEYTNQEFYNRPTTLVERETPIILDEFAIKTKYYPICLKSEQEISYIEVTAFRNNQARVLRVKDIDAAKGIIYLIDRIREQDKVIIRYAYEEYWYTYRGFHKREIEYEVIPTEVPMASEVTFEVYAKGERREIEIIEPETRTVFGLTSGFNMNDVYSDTQGINGVANRLPYRWDFYREQQSIINNPVDLLLAGRYLNQITDGVTQPNESVFEDINTYFFSNLGDGIYIVPILEENESVRAENANRTLNEFGVSVNHIGDYSTNDASIEVNTVHPIFESYNGTENSIEIEGDCELVISNSMVTPIAWIDEAREHVIIALYENGDQKVLITCNQSKYLFENDNGYKDIMNQYIEAVLGNASTIENEIIITDEKTFGPVTQKLEETYVTGRYQEEYEINHILKPTELFGEEWVSFVEEFKQHQLELTPNISHQIIGEAPFNSTINYVYDQKHPDQRSMEYNDIISINSIVSIDPILGEKILADYFFHLDLNPSPGHTHTINTNGFLEWIPLDHEIDSYEKREATSNELLVKPMHIYIRPVLIQDKNGDVINGTQNSQVIRHTDQSFWFDDKDFKYDASMFRLGKVILQPNSKIKDSVILDTRTRGGGLDEALSRKIIEEVNKESLHHWDIGYFDGQAYQENGIIIIRLPKTLLKTKDNPSGFYEKEIHEAVNKHKAFGVLPIIEFYDPEELKKTSFPDELDLQNTEIFEI